MLSDEKIIDSWRKNATPWTKAIRESQIESRTLVTNQAIVEAVLSVSPHTVLDVGCGEGWLVRTLVEQGKEVMGVDVIPELIEQASQLGRGQYAVLSYEDLAEGKLSRRFDAVVCNFSLLGKDSVNNLFGAIPHLLQPHGSFIVQTIHPVLGTGEHPYFDSWREGSWAGFNNDFSDPAPWYFRTLSTWVRLFSTNGFILQELQEPIHPNTGLPASALFVGKLQTAD